jgi:hypothetical protein
MELNHRYSITSDTMTRNSRNSTRLAHDSIDLMLMEEEEKESEFRIALMEVDEKLARL